MQSPARVLVFCAHSDDQVFGAGGYIARLAKDGVKVRTIICSFGEQSHPHLKAGEVRRTRVLESKKADRMLGGSGVMFIGLREGKFLEDYERRELHGNIVRAVREFAPDRILTHSPDDPHPDHRAVHRMLLRIHEDAGLGCEVYVFDVWNLFNLTKRKNPKLIVDITQTFKRKIDALALFRSQRTAIAILLWSVYVKAVLWGLRRSCRYAETYYRVR